ncbi:MAG: ANTAR domain-containing protein [Alphaproteobacteria bacterium]|nr:ANTAR domain-containing protein [Alphaproteobacteria bacterium]HPF46064.1 ANTAR domain-containing protein [Emcibacteraceae bacterium]HRW28593.1 ANTAR domain-containing protein [Emcibacteraceae bacterium]
MKIFVIDDDAENAFLIEKALICANYDAVISINDHTNFHQKILEASADVIIIAFQNPALDTLEKMFEVTKVVKKPVIIFVDKSDAMTIQKAISSGVSAFIVDGLKPARLGAIIEVAISRFESIQKIAEELAQARTALAERKIIEKAKGLLMARRNISEECAYKLLRNNAMKQSRKIVEIANIIISASEIDNSDLHHTDVLVD